MQEASDKSGKIMNLVQINLYTGHILLRDIPWILIFAIWLLCTYPKSLRIRGQPISIVAIVIVSIAVGVHIAPIIAIAGVEVGTGRNLVLKISLW